MVIEYGMEVEIWRGKPDGILRLYADNRFHLMHAQMATVEDIDRFCAARIGKNRPSLVRHMLYLDNDDGIPGSVSLVVNRKMEGEICGFGHIRSENSSVILGPLYADCPLAARFLLHCLIGSFKASNSGITLAVPSGNTTFQGYLKDISLKFDRIQKINAHCDVKWDQVFCLSSYDLL